MEDKLIQTESTIKKALSRYDDPVLMCSFGKDSMVLLHILLAMGYDLPIVFHRDPWFPKKYEFADEIIRRWNLTVFDYPPLTTSLWEGKSLMAFTNHYQVGLRKGGTPATLDLPKNILPPEEGTRWLCGLKDLLRRPTGFFNYSWDAAFLGHKNTDEDQIAGKVPLSCDIKQNNGEGPDGVFPMRDWNDDDIWEYTERFNVPVQMTRYAKKDGKWSELDDKTYNSDYWHACIKCCDKREPKTVHCPLLDLEVTNISDTIPYHAAVAEYCTENA